MGVIYELLKLANTDRKKFLDEVLRQETARKMKAQENEGLRSKADK